MRSSNNDDTHILEDELQTSQQAHVSNAQRRTSTALTATCWLG